MKKFKTNFKKYALLEDGTIEPLYYDNDELRRVEQENGAYYLYHDVFKGSCIAYYRHKIIKEADTKEELLKPLLKLIKKA